MNPSRSPISTPDLGALPAGAAARLDEAIEQAGVVVWQRELPGERVRLNPHGATLFGFAADADVLPLATWRECFHPEDRERFFRLPAREALRAPQVEARFLLADGRWGTLLSTVVALFGDDGQLSSLTGVALDVTEQRRAELALRQAHERAALAARGAGLGTWELDLHSGATQWDEQMWRLRGLEPRAAALTHEQQMQRVHPDDRQAMHSRVALAIESAVHAQYEFRVVWPDGRVRWLASRSGPVLNDEGRPLRRIGVNWDITDAHEATQVRQERELALRESRAKSAVLSRISHELRTPLNAVLGLSQLLLADERGEDAASAARRRRVEHIHAAGKRLLVMVDDVLQLSRVDGAGAAPATRAGDTASEHHADARPRGTLLYIEDNAVNALIVAELVKRHSHLRLHIAGTGGEGVAMATHLQPDLILLDMQLPDFDGFEVLRRMRQDARLAVVPVIALSANAMPQDIERALAAGVLTYWTKPLDFAVFSRTLAEMFA